ncbi:MAG: hypothetical protein JO112_22290, partial [Planctomycetes bacterium]|nr:hypothetical protein [Planctomycetota bacterium]
MAKRWVGVVVGALTWSLGAGLNAQVPSYPSAPAVGNYPASSYPVPDAGTYPSGGNPGYQPGGMNFGGGIPSGYPATPQAPAPALPEPYPFPAEATAPSPSLPSTAPLTSLPPGATPFDPAPLEIHPDEHYGDHGPKQKNPPYPNCQDFYIGVGATVLQRQKLGNLPLILEDPQNLDTGNPPPITAPILQNGEDLHMPWAWGPQVTVGYHLPLGEIEATGFVLPKRSSASDIMMPGRLDMFFFNPPLGFEGDNGLWLQADRVRTEFDSTLYNGEVNVHLWSDEFGHLELIGGVRYVDLLEDFNIFTDDDGLTVLDINGRPDPTRQAYYLVKTHN